MASRKGFTLIELLVVVAIIALLISILLPSLSMAKQKGRTTQCLANIRTMGTAVQTYIADWNAMFACAGSDPLRSWTQLLMNGGQAGPGGTVMQGGGYGGVQKALTCPEAPTPTTNGDPTGTAHLQWTGSSLTDGNLSASYGINGWMYNASATSANSTDFSYLLSVSALSAAAYSPYFYSVPLSGNEARTPIFADANWRHVFPKSGDPAPSSLENNGPTVNLSANPQSHPIQRFVMNRHDRAVNVSFMDGHAETVSLPQLWTLTWSPNWQQPSPIPTLPAQ